MRSRFQQLPPALAFAVVASALCAQMALAKKGKETSSSQMPEQKRAMHALNRLTFGPRPGDSNRVMAMGVDQWIDQQLHPDKIDDHALEARLAPLRTLRMDTRDIVENFPPEQVIKAVAEGKQSLPSDPSKRAVYKAQLERFEQKQERKQGGADAAVAPGEAWLTDDERARRHEERLYADLRAEQILDLPPDQRMREILKMPPEDQRALAASLKGDKRDEFLEGMDAKQRETLMALNNPQQVVVDELVQAKLLRAIYSERQLQEVMTDFWFNHFNVFIGKGADRYLMTSYERDVIRPHALGKFEDLLVATAQSPAMLFYIKSNGEKEGREVLQLLARHPSTAKFICTKLATRFVSDNPPPALVDRMSQTFLKKKGDISEVLRTLFRSPEFWAPDAYRAKVKTPLEFVVSAVRANGANVTDALPLARQLQNMGMPLYGMQPPTGYSMKADAWVNSSALLGRMNFALTLTSGKLTGVQLDSDRTGNLPADPRAALASLENTLHEGDVSQQTHDTIANKLQDPQISGRKLDDPVRPSNVSNDRGSAIGLTRISEEITGFN